MEEEDGDAEEDISRRNSSSLSDKVNADTSNRSGNGNNNGSNSNPDAKSSNTDEKSAANGTHFTLVKSLVDAEDWKTLNDGDELAAAIQKKECLAGFKTLPCNFPPTFKVARGEGYSYNEKRTPSYTDRILWKSAHGVEDNVVPFLYEPCPDFITSDHKPIRGGYKVKMNAGPSSRHAHLETGNSGRKVHLIVSNIKCMNLPIMDTGVLGGLSDPYILFISYPKPVLWKNSWPSTKVIKRQLNPEWKEDIHFTLDRDALCGGRGGQISLAGVMLYMTVMDKDISSGDDIIGTVALNLSHLCSDLDIQGGDKKDHSSSLLSKSINTSTKSSLEIQKTAISQPIRRNGQEFGTLECTVSSAYLEGKKEIKAFLKESSNKVRAKRRQISFTNRISSLFSFL